jgi:hypothetical protein
VLLVAIGLYQTSKANNATQKATNSQLLLAIQQQTAQRFSDAIGQLGQEDEKRNDKLGIRLGAIYSLQRLMKDAPDYEPTIIQVLCAFIRTHASRTGDLPRPQESTAPTSALDVITAVETLGHRPDPDNSMHRQLNFSNAIISIPKESVPWGYLDGINLSGAQLEGANFTNSSLAGATLNITQLNRANLSGAILNGANLQGARIWDAELFGTWLQHANLTDTFLGESNLLGARLQGADLSRADLSGANLMGTDLRAVKGLSTANLTCVRINKETLFPPDFSKSGLTTSKSPPCVGAFG